MAYFPFFMELRGMKCAVIGGGTVACRKIEKLLPFGAEITVTAPEICDEIRSLPVQMQARAFRPDDLDGAFLAIAATDDPALNHMVYTLCTERQILCNAVDDIENCSFIFPALVQSGDITVGITTGGTSPAFAKYLRQEIGKLMDARTVAAAKIMQAARPVFRASLHTEAARKEAADRLLARCLAGETLPDAAEIAALTEEIRSHETENRDAGQ